MIHQNSSFHAPAKNLNLVDLRPKENEVKGAVKLDPFLYKLLDNFDSKLFPDANATFVTFDKEKENLQIFISNLSRQLQLPQETDQQSYGLMFEGTRSFLTEDNRNSVQQGFLLVLTASPETCVRNILKLIEKHKASFELGSELLQLCTDSAFALAFQEQDGYTKLIRIIEAGHLDSHVSLLFQVLQAFELLLNTYPKDWTHVSSKFVEKLALYINGGSKVENNDILSISLKFLINVLNKCPHLEELIKNTIPFESCVRQLGKSDERILLYVLTLMNILYEKANEEDKITILKVLHDKPFRLAIENMITREPRSHDPRIFGQIVHIQRIFFKELHGLAMRIPKDEEIEHIVQMKEWYSSEQDSLASNDSQNGASRACFDDLNCHTWGPFRSLVKSIPPGSLAIDAIIDFAKSRPLQLEEILIESSLTFDSWPLIMARLVNILIRVLAICDLSSEANDSPNQNVKLLTVVFKSEKPFHELFAQIVLLFHRTWREMHANLDELAKVISVVDDQFERAIKMNPSSFDEIEHILQHKISYFHMQKIWEQERLEKEELELQNPIIRELHDYLRPSIEAIVLKARKNRLKAGTNFMKVLKGKHPTLMKTPNFWHWKLDESERFLCYMDCKIRAHGPEEDQSTIKKVPIFSIRQIVSGNEYRDFIIQHNGLKTFKKSSSSLLAQSGFCIEVNDQTEPFNLTTDDESNVTAWVEGLTCLLNPTNALQMSSIKADVDQMLGLEVRIRLCDLNTPTLDLEPPPAPPNEFSWIPEAYRNLIVLK
uniref:ELMO domain-containing protein n=1 Tax=Acrobeloides nanus TaxID=290746 RepID=A0A914BVX8_9BILA